jgi:hypothetical protein
MTQKKKSPLTNPMQLSHVLRFESKTVQDTVDCWIRCWKEQEKLSLEKFLLRKEFKVLTENEIDLGEGVIYASDLTKVWGTSISQSSSLRRRSNYD